MIFTWPLRRGALRREQLSASFMIYSDERKDLTSHHKASPNVCGGFCMLFKKSFTSRLLISNTVRAFIHGCHDYERDLAVTYTFVLFSKQESWNEAAGF